MPKDREVVITGLGVVSPIGIGCEAFWTSLEQRRSGVRRLSYLPPGFMPVDIGAEVLDFDPKKLIKARKSLKIMSREIQMAVVAADEAMLESALAGNVAPERFGVIFGADMIQVDPPDLVDAFRSCLIEGHFDFDLWGERAIQEVYPLWFLKLLPNMPACHVGIGHDARGPTNSITLGEVSSLLAIAEAAHVIRRGQADAMIAGGTGSRVHPTTFVRTFVGELARPHAEPAAASRPFDATRSGLVNGEGSAALILESREHAEGRGAKILARIAGQAASYEPRQSGGSLKGQSIRTALQNVLGSSGLTPKTVGHVNAHGLSTKNDDAIEARAIADLLGNTPVTAPKSFFGTLGSGAGAVEMAASVLALQRGSVPVTLNYEQAAPDCPVRVVHERPLTDRPASAVLLNHSPTGQAAALAIVKD